MVETGVTPTAFLHAGDWQGYLAYSPAGEGPVEMFYRAYALWQLGNEQQAQGILDACARVSATDRFARFCEVLGDILRGNMLAAATQLDALQLARDSDQAFDGEIDFKIAQMQSMIGATDAALLALQLAWERGFRCFSCLQEDPSLIALQTYTPFLQWRQTLSH